jgi:hypothetical protein
MRTKLRSPRSRGSSRRRVGRPALRQPTLLPVDSGGRARTVCHVRDVCGRSPRGRAGCENVRARRCGAGSRARREVPRPRRTDGKTVRRKCLRGQIVVLVELRRQWPLLSDARRARRARCKLLSLCIDKRRRHGASCLDFRRLWTRRPTGRVHGERHSSGHLPHVRRRVVGSRE